MPEYLEIIISTIGTIVLCLPILGPVIYFACIRDHLYNYRERKGRRLYPEYFELLDKRNSLRENEIGEARHKEYLAKQSIDLINKEMPYTPLEDISSKQMEIEVLKKEKIKAHEDLVKYEELDDTYAEQMRNMRKGNKLLTKFWYMGL